MGELPEGLRASEGLVLAHLGKSLRNILTIGVFETVLTNCDRSLSRDPAHEPYVHQRCHANPH